MQLVLTAVRAGKTMQRVHVIREPFTQYLVFEIAWSYAYSVAAGEDVRIISLAEAEAWPCGIPCEGGDYWLFDASELFRMQYTPDGDWLGVERVLDPHWIETAEAQRGHALTLAEPWLKFINKHPDLARRVPDVQWPN
jgi:hypothetical protein